MREVINKNNDNILVAEDQIEFAKLLKQGLTEAGYNCLKVNNGKVLLGQI